MWILGPTGLQVRVVVGTIPTFALTVVRTSQPRRSKLQETFRSRKTINFKYIKFIRINLIFNSFPMEKLRRM